MEMLNKIAIVIKIGFRKKIQCLLLYKEVINFEKYIYKKIIVYL